MIESGGWYHCSVKTIGRSAGRSVVAAAAYRLGERLHEAGVDVVHDYRRRQGVEAAFTVAPSHAPDWVHEPERLWNAADQAETRKNSTLAREVELALPDTVSVEIRTGIARDFAAHLVERYGVAVSVAIHAPSRDGDQRNHHAHILFTTRRMEADGLGKKCRELDSKATGSAEIVHLREVAANLINVALADSGSDEQRVDHRSFKARGIEREPTQHRGKAATGMERRGKASERGDINRAIEAGNGQHKALTDELARLQGEIAAEQTQTPEIEEPTAPAVPVEPDLAPVEPANHEKPSHAPPQTAEEAAARVRAAAKPFAWAIATRGEVQDIQQHDRLASWLRVGLGLLAVAPVLHEVRDAVRHWWQHLRGSDRQGRDEKSRDREKDFDHEL